MAEAGVPCDEPKERANFKYVALKDASQARSQKTLTSSRQAIDRDDPLLKKSIVTSQLKTPNTSSACLYHRRLLWFSRLGQSSSSHQMITASDANPTEQVPTSVLSFNECRYSYPTPVDFHNPAIARPSSS